MRKVLLLAGVVCFAATTASAFEFNPYVAARAKYAFARNEVKGTGAVDFKEKLNELLPDLKIVLSDERLTTVIVDKTMIAGNMRRDKRKELKDEMAAVVILQDYLDRK